MQPVSPFPSSSSAVNADVYLVAYENHVITTRSNPSAFPSALRQKKTSLVQQRDVEKKKVFVSLAPR